MGILLLTQKIPHRALSKLTHHVGTLRKLCCYPEDLTFFCSSKNVVDNWYASAENITWLSLGFPSTRSRREPVVPYHHRWSSRNTLQRYRPHKDTPRPPRATKQRRDKHGTTGKVDWSKSPGRESRLSEPPSTAPYPDRSNCTARTGPRKLW